MLSAVVTALLSVCPEASVIEQRLQSIRGTGAHAPTYRLEVARTDAVVTLTARDPHGATWLQRELPAGAPCTELEEAAAVVLLAWEADLPPVAVPVPEVPRAEVAAAVSEPPATRLEVRTAASGQLWLSSASPTWGARGSLELRGKRFGVQLDLSGQGQRQLALGMGHATWSRFTVAVGPTVSLSLTSGVDVSLGAALAVGPFWVSGSGFDTNHPLVDWDVGVTARAQVLLPGFWQVRPFIGVDGVTWLRRHVAEAATPDASVVIPFVEAAPTFGLVLTP